MEKKHKPVTVDRLFRRVFVLNGVELEGDNFWDVEDILGEEFTKVFGKGHVDDLTLSAFAFNTEDDPRIHGKFRFCVYGGIKYEDLKSLLENAKSDILTIEGLYHPVQTPGISHNGVYEDRDTTYIGGKFTIREAKK